MNARDATAVLEALPLAVLMAEPGGRVTYANAAAHALFSHDVEALTPPERARCWATRHLDGSAMSSEDLPTMRAIRGERLRDLEYRITHADGTARVQTVSAADNPLYHRLISRFDEITGVPMVVNTSFNDNEEPIVCTPAEAVNCYLRTKMDALALGPFWTQK